MTLAYQSGKVAGEDLGKDAEQPADCWESLCSWRQRGEQLAAAEVGVADVAAAVVVVLLEEVKVLLLYARAVKSGGTVVALAVGSLWPGHTAEK